MVRASRAPGGCRNRQAMRGRRLRKMREVRRAWRGCRTISVGVVYARLGSSRRCAPRRRAKLPLRSWRSRHIRFVVANAENNLGLLSARSARRRHPTGWEAVALLKQAGNRTARLRCCRGPERQPFSPPTTSSAGGTTLLRRRCGCCAMKEITRERDPLKWAALRTISGWRWQHRQRRRPSRRTGTRSLQPALTEHRTCPRLGRP